MRDIVQDTPAAPPSPQKAQKRFSQMPEAERIALLGDFLAETTQVVDARKAVLRTYRGWRLAKSGTFITLTGLSGAGKTTVADIVLEDLEEEWQGIVSDGDAGVVEPRGPMPTTAGITKEKTNGVIRPVIKVLVEPKARCRGLLRDILRALGVRPTHHATFGDLMEMLELHLREQEVRLILLDEIHHIVEGQGITTAYEASEVVKMLLLQARVQIVGIGLPHAESIIDNNPELPRHLRGRFKMAPLAGGLNPDGDFMRFLRTLSSELPFDRVPDLTEPWTALRISVATEGLVGKIMNLVQAAATLAIEDGLKTFDKSQLRAAFAAIEGVGDAENPFAMKNCDEASYAAIRNRIAARRRRINGSARQRIESDTTPKPPSLKKSR